MLEAHRKTEKIYYVDQYAKSINARIVQITQCGLELDRTVAYPEGGGQESDSGWLQTAAGILHFVSAQLLHATPIDLDGFNGGKSGGVIVHQISEPEQALLAQLEPGMQVCLHIDVLRRQKLTLSHSASHFVYAAALALRPELKASTIGCHIKEDGARFDFLTAQPFLPDEIGRITEYANAMLARQQPIKIDIHPQNNEARTWVYEDVRIPCGGTHLTTPTDIGSLQVSRKNLGKNKERLLCNFANAQINTDAYHDWRAI